MLATASAIIYPYIIPMLLGRTFDLFTAQVGVDIFSQDAIRNPIRIHRSYVTSDFRLIRNDSDARSFLGVSEDLSLRVKAGVLKIGTYGDYLRDIQRRDNYVEILVKCKYETMTETLHGSKDPIEDWDLLSPNYLGTHFVRSITYGGSMLASLRLMVKNRAEKTSLEKFLASHFNFSETKITLGKTEDEIHFVREMNTFEEKLKKMMYEVNSQLGSDLSLRIKYYSTVTAPRVPQDIPSFLSVLEDFPFQAQQTNGGMGVPINAELMPLHELSVRMAAVKPSSILNGFLGTMEDKYNDLLFTHNSLKSMTNDGITDYGKQCRLRDLGMEVHDKLDVFNNAIQHLNTGSPDAVGLGERAIQAYEQRANHDSYADRLKRLEEELKISKAKTGNILGSGTLQGAKTREADNALDSSRLLEQFGHMAELAMANGVCASFNKLGGSFITMRRNCSVGNNADVNTCSTVCNRLQTGPNYRNRAECVSVVAALLQTPQTLGAQTSGLGEVVGAQTANLGRASCDRPACFREYCCCRLSRFTNGII